MKKDFIYIRICDGMNLGKTKIILNDKCNKIVYEETIVNLNNIKIPICHNDIYKLFIIIKLNGIKKGSQTTALNPSKCNKLHPPPICKEAIILFYLLAGGQIFEVLSY